MLTPSKDTPTEGELYRTPSETKAKQLKSASKTSLNISMLSEYITTGFKSLNDAMKKLKKLKRDFSTGELSDFVTQDIKQQMTDIYTHLKLGERSMYLVFESGMLKWAENKENTLDFSSSKKIGELGKSDLKKLVQAQINELR
jgi:hypothetical protein